MPLSRVPVYYITYRLSTRSNVRERKAETTMATVEIGGRTTGTLTVDERDDRHPLWNTWWHNLLNVQR